MTTLKDVPKSKLASKVRQLALSGVSEIHCLLQEDGRWTIKAKI